jgi:hypothetical protein
LAVLFNPLGEALHRRIELPLYYTGLHDEARVRIGTGEERRLPVDRDYRLALELDLAPGMTWIELR